MKLKNVVVGSEIEVKHDTRFFKKGEIVKVMEKEDDNYNGEMTLKVMDSDGYPFWVNHKYFRRPRPKKLDQSIFDGLDEKWRFAAVDADGSANGFDVRVYPRGDDKYGLFAYADDYANSDDNSIRLGEGYDASNWQNSLIERDTAKELLEVDLSSELTGSDYYYSNTTSALLESGSKLVVCFVSNLSESDALSEKHIEVILGLDVEFNDSDDYGWQYAIPINNQGEPLTAKDVGL